MVKLWRAHWSEFTPFLAFPPEVRRVIYTTNLIESMNARLRKVTRNRGQFPSEQAALKGLYLAVRNLEEYRRPNVGTRSSGWKQAIQSVHDLLRGTHPHTMTATITYTDRRTLPREKVPSERTAACRARGVDPVTARLWVLGRSKSRATFLILVLLSIGGCVVAERVAQRGLRTLGHRGSPWVRPISAEPVG